MTASLRYTPGVSRSRFAGLARRLQIQRFSNVESLMSLTTGSRGLRPIAATIGLVLSFSDASAATETRFFEHQDARYLYQGQHHGGAVLLPESVPADRPVPVVVFLHGASSSGGLHLWLGGGGATYGRSRRA